jgi:hypothetical protein
MDTAGRNLTVGAGLRIVTRARHRRFELLAGSLFRLLEEESWFTKEWRVRFCAYLLENIVDQAIESEVDMDILNRLKRIPMSRAIKLIRNGSPEAGLKALAALICIELRMNQKLDLEQQYIFYNVLVKKLFPDLKSSRGSSAPWPRRAGV